MGQQFQALFERGLRFKRLAAIEAGAIVSSSVAGIVLALMGFGVWSLVWATIANTVVKAGVLAIIGWNTWRPMLHFVPRECRRFCASASTRWASARSTWWASTLTSW